MRVLVVGQTPPPITGQAVVIAQILDGDFPGISLRHVPMRFSAEIDEIGRFRWRKLVELARVVALIAWERLRWRADVLFYPPAGGNKIPIARDIVILLLTRWMFRFTVFHFHAGGIGATCDSAPAFLRPFFRWAYSGADLAIRPASLAGPITTLLRAGREIVIPNGVSDEARSLTIDRPPARTATILYLSQISPRKGILTLLKALKMVATTRPGSLVANIVGPFASQDIRVEVERAIDELGVRAIVTLPGELSGRAKAAAYASADIFCFPSCHPTETFGLVAIEAMSFALPVVASDWAGIREIVDDGATGLLFPPGDHLRLAEALERLICDAEMRVAMGRRGRRKYLANFTVERFRDRLGAALLSLAAERPDVALKRAASA